MPSDWAALRRKNIASVALICGLGVLVDQPHRRPSDPGRRTGDPRDETRSREVHPLRGTGHRPGGEADRDQHHRPDEDAQGPGARRRRRPGRPRKLPGILPRTAKPSPRQSTLRHSAASVNRGSVTLTTCGSPWA